MVGISLLTLVPGGVGGSEGYARELARALARVGQLEYRVFVPPIAPDAAGGLASRTITAYPASYSTPGRIAAMLKAVVTPQSIRRQLETENLAVVHFPLTLPLPRPRHTPFITTLLDVQHLIHPQFFSRAERAYRKLVYDWAFQARRVIAISEHVKETLVERTKVEPDRIQVIHLGIDHERFRPDGGAREPFLLYPANRWPHKNHERLFEAVERVRRERPELTLVLTGSGHEGKPAPEGVVVRGRVAPEELVCLYRTASALVFPSLYEGFGQPPLEAMACGCPVATSSAGSLPEVCGDAARYFDPRSPTAIADGVLDVLAHPDEWAPRGIARAAQFSWDECAREHEELYHAVSSG